MNKKADFGMEQIVKLLLLLFALLIILMLTWLLKDKMIRLLENFVKMLRFR